MTDNYVLGIDAGTEVVKAGLFDLRGQPIAYASRPYKTYFPRPGWAEQDPDEWWAALAGAVRECVAEADVPPESVIGLSADATTCTLLAMDEAGRHIGRALLWMDVRAADQARHIFATGHEALRYSLAGVNAEWMPCKALWLKEERPDIYQAADILFEYTDWIMYKLTGRYALNINTVTQRWYYHRPGGGWPLDFYATIGLDDVADKFPTEVLDIGQVVGGLTREAAAELGLKPGTAVATGGGDAFVALLGLNVVEPGELALIAGSSNVHVGLSATEFHVPGIFGSYPDAIIKGLNLVEGGQVSTGSVLSWFKKNFGAAVEEEARRSSRSVYQVLDEEAKAVPPGSEGLIVLDYFQGNRTPYTDSLARGAVWGLSLSTGRGHIFRAMMEGIAYGTEHILRTFAANGYQAQRIIACGGATNSPLFMQIYADVCGVPLYITRVSEASLLGSAVVAAVGAGAYGSLQKAAGQMVEITDAFEPDDANHQRYKFYVEKYIQTYPQLKDLMHEMSQHVSGAQ